MIDRRAVFAIFTAYFLLFSSMAVPESARAASTSPDPLVPAAQNPAGPDPALDLRCDQLADSPDDASKVGTGVRFEQINVADALPACQLAAAQGNPRAKYQYLVGRVLDAAKRYDEAVKWYAAADQNGYALASFNLGQLYEEGLGVTQDYAQAARLYERAASGGDAWAYIYLGDLYDEGLGVTKDAQQVVNYYYKAGQAGIADGYAQLAAFYGRYNPPDYAKEITWAQKAVQAGSAYGNVLLGWLYQFGKGVTRDPATAIRYYTAAADGGSADAMYRLGLMYENGGDVRQDLNRAALCFYKAAQLGYVSAEAELGYLFYTGQGVKKDPQAAYSWFLPAAEAGLTLAQNALGTMYEAGEGVTQSDSDAVAWFQKSALAGDVFGMDRLAVHLRLGRGVTWDESAASQWFQKAAEAGYAPSESSYGYGFMQGLGGFTQDYNQAATWLTRAAQQGDPYAILNLGVLYQNGWGVEQNPRTAHDLYMKVVDNPNPQVARAASEDVARLQQSLDETDARHLPGSSDTKAPDWVPALALGIGFIALVSLFSGSGHDGSNNYPSGTIPGGGYPGADTNSSGSTPAPRTPVCHTIPDSIGSMTPNGTAMTNPWAGGGATHLECN